MELCSLFEFQTGDVDITVYGCFSTVTFYTIFPLPIIDNFYVYVDIINILSEIFHFFNDYKYDIYVLPNINSNPSVCL